VTNLAERISVLSTEYLRVPVRARSSGAWVNPTSDVVTMALPYRGVTPVSGDWHPASWETDATVTPNLYFARLLVGPVGGTLYQPGTYDVYVKIADNPEVPVLQPGEVVFY
jgi:hypothetical protein